MISGFIPSSTGQKGFAFPAILALMTAVVLISVPGAGPAQADDAVSRSFETIGTYTLGPGDSKPLGHRLALFRAKRLAADAAADQFAREKLIQFVDRDKEELVLLVADSLRVKLVEDRCRAEGDTVTCRVRARTVVRLSDFIDAQLASLRLADGEKEANYRDEMEPELPEPLQPGHVLAKVRRLIHSQEVRMAIIYLDRLAGHYPNWREIGDLKAVALGH